MEILKSAPDVKKYVYLHRQSMSKRVSLLESVKIQKEDFSLEKEIEEVKAASKRIGGIVTFLGTARDFSKGKEIKKLVFEHYEDMAIEKLKDIREKALEKFDIIEVSIIHRTGEIEIGENIVLIIVAAEHRKDAFSACTWLIDELKKVVPIWKKEITTEGEIWVEEHA
jgi:molybdopterin synthase catalytic subunit